MEIKQCKFIDSTILLGIDAGFMNNRFALGLHIINCSCLGGHRITKKQKFRATGRNLKDVEHFSNRWFLLLDIFILRFRNSESREIYTLK